MDKTKDLEKISLSNYDPENDLSRFQFDLIELLGRRIFEITSFSDLYFNVLKLITETKEVENNSESIQFYTNKALKHFDLGLSKTVKLSHNASIETFNYNSFLGIDKLPYDELSKIKPFVEGHLREINQLIDYYESLEPIKNLLKGEDRIFGHSNLTIVHFYSRCVQQRKLILDYYLDGIYKRVMLKSKFGYNEDSPYFILDKLHDIPYRMNEDFIGRNYDHRNIDCATRRLYYLNISNPDEVSLFVDLYKDDKESFYVELFKRNGGFNQIFQSIDDHLELLPSHIIGERRIVFEELKILFSEQRWLAFYALALPQVEGLFSEMLKTSKSKTKGKALPAKVRAIRLFTDVSEKNLDYFEYVLPEQRNTFAHGGLLQDIKLYAYDLLTDLEFVLEIFSRLDNPEIAISGVINRRSVYDFFDLESVVNYFSVLDELKLNKEHDFIEKIKGFNKEFLIGKCPLKHYAKGGLFDFLNLRDELDRQLHFNFFSEDNFPKLGEKASIMKDINKEQINRVRELVNSYEYDFEYLILLDSFFKGVKKYISEQLNSNFLKRELETWGKYKFYVMNAKELYSLYK